MKKSVRMLVLVCLAIACMAVTATAKPFNGGWVFDSIDGAVGSKILHHKVLSVVK